MKSWVTRSGIRIMQILSGRSNVFLLTNGEKNILIDTGTSYMLRLLEKRLNKLQINHINYLILTHTHSDHAGNAQWIKEKYKSMVIVHKDEASFLTIGDNIIPQGTNPLTRIIVNIFAKTYASRFIYDSCEYDILVNSFFDLKNMGFNAFILHTPGHTIGSMSVIVDDQIALVGDTMFGVFRWSVFPPFANDINEMIKSWGKLLETNCSVFIPSHGSANNRISVQKDYYKRNRLLNIEKN